MEDPVISTVEVDSVQAILEGGPATIPATSRLRQVGALDEKVKLLHYGGYEHFERAGARAGGTARGQVVFRWTMRTELAE